MKFYYDAQKTKELEAKLVEHWVKTQIPRGKEVHVYDVVYCPTKAYCRLTDVEPYFTKQVIGFFVFGVVSQQIIQELFPPDEREYIPKKHLLDIIGHIDVFELKLYPEEIKSSRKHIIKRSDVPQKWVEQLQCYMAKTDKNVGWLIILNIWTTGISCFCLEMTNEELAMQRLIMKKRKEKLLASVITKNPDLLDVSPEEYDTCIYKKKCPRRTYCRNKKKEIGKQQQLL